MTNNLEALEDWAAGLLEKLEPASRNKLVRGLGHALRRRQQQRIFAQKNSDGSKYMPRKQRKLHSKQDRVKRKVKMFQKLRSVRYLKTQSDENTINLGFVGRIAKIAKVHQYGLKDHGGSGRPHVTYDRREILGFTEADLDIIRDGLLQHLRS